MQSAFSTLQDAIRALDLPPGTRVVAAVSGGPDSVALLDALASLAPETSWQVLIAHVNHSLRGAESDRDEKFVRALAADLGLPAEIARVDTRAWAEERHQSLETAARELRYRELERIRREWSGDLIATGHTRDDQAETVMLHLLRGTGLRGLGGMQPRSGYLARPFLTVARETVLEALRQRGRSFAEDRSNRDLRYQRNLIRHRVMPILRETQPQMDRLLERSARLLRLDEDFLSASADRALDSLDVRDRSGRVTAALAPWRSLHPALRAAVLRHLLQALLGSDADIEEEHVALLAQSLLAGDDVRDRLPRGLQLTIEDGTFSLRQGPEPRRRISPAQPLQVPGITILPKGELEAALFDVHDRDDLQRMVTVCGPMHALLDVATLSGDLEVRSRLPGDRMRPLHAPGSRKLQDILVDRGVPRSQRDSIPVVLDAEGILWLTGLALDQRPAISGETTRVLHLRWSPERSD